MMTSLPNSIPGDSMCFAARVGAAHLMNLMFEHLRHVWVPGTPDILSYHQDGWVYFRRSDTGAWDILHASEITLKMMEKLPAEEQERIRAHADWSRLFASSYDQDSKGRLTKEARAARRKLTKVTKTLAGQ